MRVIKSVGLIVLGVLVGIAGSRASARVEAQAPRFQAVQPAPEIQLGQPVGNIITGENIGFQRSGLPPSGGTVTGRLVVKVDGQWFEAVPSK